jgi:MHS family proline/betaine transporter-like MFS transporter
VNNQTEQTSACAAAADVVDDRKSNPKLILAGCLGSLVEYYDFAVYGYIAVIIAAKFFPEGDPAAATLSSLAIFAIAFFVRPLGGVFWGHLGDLRGRKAVLSATIVTMGVATALMALIPTYATIGVSAAVLLVLIRCVQGFAAGGELGGAVTYVSESVPRSRRAFLTSFVMVGSLGASAVAATVVALTTTLVGPAVFEDWAWRIPLLLALPMTAIGLYIRLKLMDTAAFNQAKSVGREVSVPVLEIVTKGWRSLLRLWGLLALQTMLGYFCVTFLYIYMFKYLGYTALGSYWGAAVSILIGIAFVPVGGYLADRIGRLPVVRVSALLAVVGAYPILELMNRGIYALAVLGMITLFAICCIYSASSYALCIDNLPTRYRFTGMALGINVPLMVVGGTAPLMSAWLIESTGNTRSPAFLICGIGILALLTSIGMRETKGIDLRDIK